MKHCSTRECMLIIYNETANHAIEEQDVCRGGERASMAITLPIKVESSSRSPKKHLKFEIPSYLLKSLPKFSTTAYSVSDNGKFELDPPRDVYGKLKLTSPKEARFTVTFRPSASNPHLLHNFTFVFSQNNETIVSEVFKDNLQ
ncbi:unnamed protein product [Taenia asiatica]|uniref:Uncharacterized protein n=1 Tax=Taenia asiatica TaxID=60517 RepID=A0A3P6Q4T1_TAEAS|nr:unnamed protein product [Taenia asiatica]